MQGSPCPSVGGRDGKGEYNFFAYVFSGKKYIFESMSGGVVVIDYDHDGWPDLYFTNAPTINMAVSGQKVLGALYHNNHDGTFTDVTQKVG